MERFTERVIYIIQRIPSGKVMAYGQIAKCAGSPRGARQVVRILHSMSANYQLPWHRVINSKGEIGIKSEEGFINQKIMLEEEGVRFTSSNRIDLDEYRFNPDDNDITEQE